MSIAVVTKSCKYFAAPFFAKALNAKLHALDHSRDNFFGIDIEVNKFTRKLHADYLFIIGTRTLLYMAARIDFSRFKKVAVIFSDTNCARLEKQWKKVVRANDIYTYAMPDLMQYCYKNTVPIFQTFYIPDIETSKPDDHIVICHSPGQKAEYKGTDHIIKTVEKLSGYNIELKIIKDATWEECLQAKASSHIMVDQVVLGNKNFDQGRFNNRKKYLGAVAKSGLEGMMLGCCTISGCPDYDTSEYFPGPPVVYTDYSSFYKDLKTLIEDKEKRERTAEEQLLWAKTYLSAEFIRSHAMQHILPKKIEPEKQEETEVPFFENNSLTTSEADFYRFEHDTTEQPESNNETV